MDSRWNNVSVTELLADLANAPELRRELLLLEMTLESLQPSSVDERSHTSGRKRYRMAELINSHRRNRGGRTT